MKNRLFTFINKYQMRKILFLMLIMGSISVFGQNLTLNQSDYGQDLNFTMSAPGVAGDNTTRSNIQVDLEGYHYLWRIENRKNGNLRFRNVTNEVDGLFINGLTNEVVIPGDLTANGVLLTSDERLKENIDEFESGLDVVLGLAPIEYNFTEESGYDTERRYYSVRAQELLELAPGLVHEFEHEDGEVYYKIDQSAMTWILVNAIKEQQALIEKMQGGVVGFNVSPNPNNGEFSVNNPGVYYLTNSVGSTEKVVVIK